MRNFLVLFVLVLVIEKGIAQVEEASKLNWYSNLAQAYDVSKSTRKPIMAFFTGSDWCGWCFKLQKDVFSKSDFIVWANQNVVLIELDYPRKKQLPPELIQQNSALQKVFGVNSFPTVWLFDLNKEEATNRFNIIPIGSLGYPQNVIPGREQLKFLSDINLLLTKRVN